MKAHADSSPMRGTRMCELNGALGNGYTGQWRIQDFPEGGAPTLKLGLFCTYFAENCMKMTEFLNPGRGCASLAPPLDPPMLVAV